MEQVCMKYSIPRSSLRDHYVGKINSRKIRPTRAVTKEEENKLVFYMEEENKLAFYKEKMVRVCYPVNTI